MSGICYHHTNFFTAYFYCLSLQTFVSSLTTKSGMNKYYETVSTLHQIGVFHHLQFGACKPRNESIILLQQRQFKHYLPSHAIRLSSVADGSTLYNTVQISTLYCLSQQFLYTAYLQEPHHHKSSTNLHV